MADRLRTVRRRRFVGRAAELELFRAAMAAPEPPFSVLWVHGPGGVGKTALLDALAEVAAGRAPVRLDLRAIEPSPPAFRTAIGDVTSQARPLLLLDTFEAATALEEWLRLEFLPGLPADALVVVAGRLPPGPAWRRDPGWCDLLRAVSLRNLAPEDAHEYLETAGVPAGLRERVVELTHGHPLALALVVDLLASGDDLAALELAAMPDVLRPLLEGFLAGVPGPRERHALQVAAHARTTTEDLLRAALDDEDAGERFAWLRGLSFIERSPHGLFPHDLARDVIEADLRWRDPVAHEDLHRRIRRHVVARIKGTRGREHERAVADLIFLHRGNPVTSAFWDWESLGQVYADPVRPADHSPILAMIERHEGAESAAIAAHWLGSRPEWFVAFRGRGAEPLGFMATVELHAATPEELEPDPGSRAMWEHVRRHAPPRPGEEVLALRFFVDRDRHQRPSASFNVVTMHSLQQWVGRPRLAHYLIVWADADAGLPMMAYIDYHRAPDADFVVGGHRYGVFARDWRRGGSEAWLDLMGERELAAPPPPPPAPAPRVALSQPEFAAAVRRALRDLHNPTALAANPLLRSRLLCEDAGPEALAALVREAVSALRDDTRAERLFRALDQTYVRPAPTQEAAAELLGLPFSTYRGHLTRGVQRVVDALWEREVYS